MSHSLPEGWFESGHGSVVVFVRDFRDPLERKKKLLLKPWASVKDIKDQLQVVFNVPTNAQKLFYLGRELKNAHNLHECGIYHDSAVLDFVARRQQNVRLLYADVDATQSAAAATSVSQAPPAQSAAAAFARTGPLASSNGVPTSSRKPLVGASIARENVRPEQAPVISIHPYGAHLLPVTLMKITHQALQGLALGLAPVLAMDGTGGTYFLKDPMHRNVGCFKPQDEEPFGPFNPRGLIGKLGQSGLRRGILSGEACERELAAYLLDKDHFAGVPATSLVEARHPVFKYSDAGSSQHFKVGSLQEFVRHDDVVSDLAPSQFTTHEVHKIVLLDMRLLNTDRNDANILVRKRRVALSSSSSGSSSGSKASKIEYELIPIDHGYCLPQYLEIAWCDWCWFNWPQLQEPLSPADKAYVLSLSTVADSDLLAQKIPLRKACRRNLLIADLVVQKGVRADLVLLDIARIMCRDDDLDALSVLEQLCLDAFHQMQKTKRRGSESQAASPRTSLSLSLNPNGTNQQQKQKLAIDVDAIAAATTTASPSACGSGATSPPGFWASFAPFSAFDDEKGEEEEDLEEEENSQRLTGSTSDWDERASRALTNAAASTTANGFATSSYSSVPSSFSNTELEKDEFEVLNDALDSNAVDEKLFLTILSRLLDEHVDKIRRERNATMSSQLPLRSRRL